ncbi:hypothetical protein AZI85_06015 [Bdellovibrio bacteriovorus]|uniref:Uncharacterized protein n=1 Tax=Bdellovibrio bacteriovorus TaxID=959 RepID=A0A150WFY0_BDEBC|nr:hypothetical protein [Bdellovibrio bacteriovorus]KYG61775.1 hypothetical protein AZI85_06015 [Bdellovibrio bacteriovorus]
MTREKALSRGFSLLDDGRTDEAISYFAELSAKDPHYHVKLALASAYAARAGVKIEKIYSFVVVKEIPQIEIAHAKTGEPTTGLLSVLRQVSAHWEKVPELSSAPREDISRALQVLEDVTEPGAALYSATLRVVYIKSLVSEGLQNYLITTQGKVCTEDLRPFFTWSLNILDVVKLLVKDVQKSFPEKQKDCERFENEIEKIKAEALAKPWPRERVCF